MKLAFRHHDTGIMPSLIHWRTGSAISHVEIVLEGGAGQLSRCFGSSWRDGGVREKHIALDPAKWIVADADIDSARLAHVMEREMGKPYDRWGVLLWGTPFAEAEQKSKWFCSELVAHVLEFDQPWNYAPSGLMDWVRI